MKQQRHTVIRELIGKAPIASQDELRRKLAGRGFHVTQATLSRDIHELRLSKGPDGYSFSNGAEDENVSLPGIREVLESFGLEVRQAANLLVLITTTGGAQPIAAGIDYEDWPELDPQYEELYRSRAYLGAEHAKPVRQEVGALARELGIADRRAQPAEPAREPEQLALAV